MDEIVVASVDAKQVAPTIHTMITTTIDVNNFNEICIIIIFFLLKKYIFLILRIFLLKKLIHKKK